MLILAAYGTAVVWLTWPLARHGATHLPRTAVGSGFDDVLIAWVLSYETHRVTTAPLALAEANIYHPTVHALFYGPAAFGALPLFAPFMLATGNPVLALNATFLVAVTLTAWVLHLVTARWLRSDGAGAVAAWTLLTTRWVLWSWGPVNPQYAVLLYFPLVIVLASVPARNYRRALPFVAVVVLQALSEVYLAVAVFAPLAVLGMLRCMRARLRPAGRRLLILLATAGLALIPFYGGYLVVRVADPDLPNRTYWRSELPMELPSGLLSPSHPTGVPTVVLALIAIGGICGLVHAQRTSARTRRAWRHGAFWIAVGLAISCTPTVRVFGISVVLPIKYLSDWFPIYDVVRVPSRLGVVALFGTAVLAGAAFVACATVAAAVTGADRRLTSVVLAAGIVASMYFQYSTAMGMPATSGWRRLPEAYPLEAPPAPSPLAPLLRDGRGPLLELPVGDLAGMPPLQTGAMFRSIDHWRPILNGYGACWPKGTPERMELARRLPDPAAVIRLREETGLSQVLVHFNALTEEARARWLAVASAREGPLRLIAHAGDDVLFSVDE